MITRKEVHEQLTDIFQNVFDDDELIIQDSTSAHDIEEWTSLKNINLLIAIETKFGVELSPNQMFSLQNVGQFIDLLLNLLNNNSPRSESVPAISEQQADSSQSRKTLRKKQRNIRQKRISSL